MKTDGGLLYWFLTGALAVVSFFLVRFYYKVEELAKQINDLLIREGKLEVMVNTMWAFQIRRSFTEAVQNNVGTINSPLFINEKAKQYLESLKNDLINFWKQNKFPNDAEALLEIERVFGQILVEKVCIPCGLSHGSCLLIAYAIAKQSDKLDIKL